MSIPLGNTTGSFTPLTSANDTISNRPALDKFSSSHSYAPEYHAQSTYITQRRLCEQLRIDGKRERMKVSIVCKDLIRYVTDHQATDVLVVGFQSTKDNPFREKQSCSLV